MFDKILYLQSKFELKVFDIMYLSSENVKGNGVHSHSKFFLFFNSDISVDFNLLH